MTGNAYEEYLAVVRHRDASPTRLRTCVHTVLAVLLAGTLVVAVQWAVDVTDANARQVTKGIRRLQDTHARLDPAPPEVVVTPAVGR